MFFVLTHITSVVLTEICKFINVNTLLMRSEELKAVVMSVCFR